eukprot:scaffold3050_cov362-Prasinococcus_capsulatus_cf.AAC.4
MKGSRRQPGNVTGRALIRPCIGVAVRRGVEQQLEGYSRPTAVLFCPRSPPDRVHQEENGG